MPSMPTHTFLNMTARPDPLEELNVEVRLDRDHHGPQLFAETVPAGTWVTGWMRRRDWSRDAEGRWRAHVHYSVSHQDRSFGYLGGFDQNDVRLVRLD